MDRYLDFKEYIRVLAKYRFFILGVLVVASLVAGVLALQQQPAYEATSLIDISGPTIQLNFDSRYSTAPPQMQNMMSLPAINALMQSPDVLEGVAQDVGLTSTGGQSSDAIESLKGMAKVSPVGSGSTLFNLQVRTNDPNSAAKIANSFASRFAQKMNNTFAPSTAPVDLIQKQLNDADQELKSADAAYVNFQKTSQITLLTKQLDAKVNSLATYVNTNESGQTTVLSQEIGSETNALATYLGAENSLRLVTQDAQNLKDQLSSNNSGSGGLSDSLAALLLEINSLNSGSKLPVQLQIPAVAGSLASGTPAQQSAALDGLISTLQAKENVASDEADRLSAQLIKLDGLGFNATSPSQNNPVAQQVSATASEILALKGQIAQQQTESDRLDLARSTAKSTYQTLATKLDEAKIEAVASGPVKVLGQATVPKSPVSSSRRNYVASGALLGLFVGVVGSFVWEYVLAPGSRESLAGVEAETVGEF